MRSCSLISCSVLATMIFTSSNDEFLATNLLPTHTRNTDSGGYSPRIYQHARDILIRKRTSSIKNVEATILSSMHCESNVNIYFRVRVQVTFDIDWACDTDFLSP